jgi:CubicO group peptidase (beta-lactamase class C family)
MRLVERGAIELESIRALLDHSSGLPAHVKLFQTARSREEFRSQILATPRDYAPGTAAVYSDLGFILLGFLLEDAGGAPLDAQFAPIAQHLGEIGFNPAASLRPRIAPTELDPWRGREIRGEVHDENAFALGGVAGHAGLFGTAAAVGRFARAVLETFDGDTWLAQRATLEEFTTKSAVPGSSRALGWDTMLPTSSCGTLMSPRAIGHTGFTGTSLWIDPEKDLYVALLTNRVHPTREGTGIQELRRSVADAIVSEF